MLHELLLALTGHCGGLFKKTDVGIEVLEVELVTVVKDIPFISPSEICLLNRLCQLGSHFSRFTVFISRHGATLATRYHTDKLSEKGELHGLYLKSFCQGLDRVLDNYRALLEKLEVDILSDHHLHVSHLQCQLEEYHLLFPALDSVVDQIESQKAHGCYILEILHKNEACGLPMVKTALKRILHNCHHVLYKQLCAWMLHGQLTDPYKEFFIQSLQEAAGQSPDTAEEEEEDLGIGGVTQKQLQKLLQDPVASLPKLCQFTLRADLLPSYIPSRVAKNILFVGESVQMFQTENLDILQKYRGSILRIKEEEFARDLHQLSQDEEFSLMRFEDMIDTIRLFVAERLWVLVVEDSDLVGHLRIIKEFYLLGRGELYLAFIDQSQGLLKLPPTSTTEHDVNMTYLQAARNVLFADDALLQRFHLTVKVTTPEPREKRSTPEIADDDMVDLGWKSLGLKYTVEWPLHILLTSGVLDRYNTIFQFLLAVKRTQLKLHKCWMLQMQRKKSQVNPREKAKWQLRTHMAFLVDNLQYYLQVDVIESLFSVLLDKIHMTRDFEAVRLAQDQFIAGLLAQSFVHMKPILHCLNKILGLCVAFCRLIVSCEPNMTLDQQRNMEQIMQKFQWQSNLLFKSLSAVRNHSASPHLAQLLLRLDYNRYFTISGGQLGSV